MAANANRPIRAHDTLLQKKRNRHISHIPRNTWIPQAADVRPKGIRRTHNQCYRRTTVQALLHNPPFLHWVRNHNTGAYPCRFNTLNCPACAFKNLINRYWTGVTSTPLPENCFHINMIDNAAWNQNLLQPWTVPRTTQEDADAFYQHMINAFADSTNTKKWKLQADALFGVNIAEERVCSAGHKRIPVSQREWQIVVPVRAAPRETLDHALDRVFAPQTAERNCYLCNGRGKSEILTAHRLTPSIESSPLILRIVISFYAIDARGNPVKHGNALQFTDTLDLTRFQQRGQTSRRRPLTYRLRSVIMHGGPSVNHGHWIFKGDGPTGLHGINDHRVKSITPQQFVQDPHPVTTSITLEDGQKLEDTTIFNTAILTYEKL